jgi:hypothetical protein
VTNWPFAIALGVVCLLIVKQFFLARTIRVLEEKNFDLRFQIEMLEARRKGLVEVHPFTGDES